MYKILNNVEKYKYILIKISRIFLFNIDIKLKNFFTMTNCFQAI